MPFMAYSLGGQQPWRSGASLGETEAGSSLLDWMADPDTSLDDMYRRAKQFAGRYPDAELEAAVRTESGDSLLLRIADGKLVELGLELRDLETNRLVDPDSDSVVLPEVRLAISAERVARTLVRAHGPCVEAADDQHVVVLLEQPDRDSCLECLGILAQLAHAPLEALVTIGDARQYLASLDPEAGCRLRPLALVHEDPEVVERFVALAELDAADSSGWTKPEVPDELLRADPAHLVQVANAPLSSGPISARIEALRQLSSEKPEGWLSEVIAGAEAPENHGAGAAEMRKELYRAMAQVVDPRVSELLWQRLRDEDDEVSRAISYHLWRQPALLERIPRTVIGAWDDDRSFAVRAVVAAIDAHYFWPEDLLIETPAEVRNWLAKEGLCTAVEA